METAGCFDYDMLFVNILNTQGNRSEKISCGGRQCHVVSFFNILEEKKENGQHEIIISFKQFVVYKSVLELHNI